MLIIMFFIFLFSIGSIVRITYADKIVDQNDYHLFFVYKKVDSDHCL